MKKRSLRRFFRGGWKYLHCEGITNSAKDDAVVTNLVRVIDRTALVWACTARPIFVHYRMMTTDEQLAKRLLYLNISILGRVELWLTYRNLKPASTITLRSEFELSNTRTKRIINWLDDANMKYSLDAREKTLIHVSKDQKLADKMAELQWSETSAHIVFRGKTYGYPPRAVNLFVKNHNELEGNAFVKGFWRPYLRYMVRKTNPKEDSLIAKKWADEIKISNPKLDQWFRSALTKSSSKRKK